MRLGIDVGGTTVKIGIIDDKKIIRSFAIPTKKETLFKDIYEAVKDEKNIEFIGFGLPGTVKDNYIVNLPNIGIKNVDINEEFKKYFPNVKIASTNDANAAALGESIAASKFKSTYFITLGTGVGGGYVYNGSLVNGSHACAGEVGHSFIDPVHNFKCGCGLNGCLETVSSATGVVRLAKTYKDKFKTNIDFDTVSCQKVFEAAKSGDELGLYVVNMMADYLGIALANIAVCCDVDAFIIGGGVMAAGDFLLDKIKESYVRHAHYGVRNIEIYKASLGNQAGMLGAAYLDE